MRQELYDNHFLSSDHYANSPWFSYSRKIFTTELYLHSTFSFKTYTFRNKVQLDTLGIVFEGLVRLKCFSSLYFGKYGILLPYLAYEVVSDELNVMLIATNYTFSYTDAYLIAKIVSSRQKNQCECRLSVLHTSPNVDSAYKKPLKYNHHPQRRNKYVALIAKDIENYSMISNFLCKKNLVYVKDQARKNSHHSKKLARLYHPLVLFNIINENYKKKKFPLDYSQEHRITKHQTFYNYNPQSNKGISRVTLARLKIDQKDYYRMTAERFTSSFHCKYNESLIPKRAFNVLKIPIVSP